MRELAVKLLGKLAVECLVDQYDRGADLRSRVQAFDTRRRISAMALFEDRNASKRETKPEAFARDYDEPPLRPADT